MSESIFETLTDERGNVSVRVSHDVQVLTREEADCIEAEYRRLSAENAKLRELISGLEHCSQGFVCDCCPLYDPSGTNHRRCESLERELGIEVDG